MSKILTNCFFFTSRTQPTLKFHSLVDGVLYCKLEGGNQSPRASATIFFSYENEYQWMLNSISMYHYPHFGVWFVTSCCLYTTHTKNSNVFLSAKLKHLTFRTNTHESPCCEFLHTSWDGNICTPSRFFSSLLEIKPLTV